MRLTVVPLLMSCAVYIVWVLYYATDWWSNPGIGGAVVPALTLLAAWVLLVIAVVQYLRRRQQHRT